MAERSVRRSLLHDQGKLESDDECSSHQYYREPSSQSSSPVTFMVVFSTFISISGSYIYGSVAGYTSPVESEIISDLDLSLAEYSVFGSMLTIGGILGVTFSGKLADLAGRRGAMWISDSFCIIGWVAIVLSEDAWSLDLGRLLLGFGIGLITYLAPVYAAEITPKNLRGAFTSINNFMMGFGVSVAYLIGSIVSWRLLALISIFPCLVQFLGLFFIPESPRWLGMKGRDEQLEASLQSLRGKNANISQEAADIKVYVENHEQGSQGRFLELFQCRYAYSITVGVGLMVLQQFGGITAYIYYTSYVLEIAGFSSNVGTIIVSICQFVLNLAGVLLIGRFGRRPLLMVSAAGMCLGSFITGLSFLLEDYSSSKEIIQVLALGGILVYLAFISFGLGPLPWVIFSEIVPINIKGSAGSLANFVYWSGAWIISYTFNLLFEWSSSGVFFVYAIISCLGIIFVGKMVPETKGRTLEEIQASVTQQHI